MPKIDLRQLLNRTLVANSNQPVGAKLTDDSAIEPSDPPPVAASPRDAPPPRSHAAPRAARAAPSVRAHRAMRPRRRS
jgi:hypothetical protein